MKIFISYPPLESEKGIPLLSQNRQFQFFNIPCFIYPIVPAQAATLLSKNNYEVIWDDGIAEGKIYLTWLERVKKERPDLIMIETKTPVIKRHWEIIKELKSLDKNLIIVLVGDHITALPEESMVNCPVDYVLTGGDYNFLLLNLCNHLIKGEELEPGIWYREGDEIKNTGKFELKHNLDSLPFIDRDLTKWKLYAYKNGNYKKTPGTYIMSGTDCWWRKNKGCMFCSWTTLYPQYRVRSVKNVLDEIGELIEKHKVKEIMDDTGTFPVGQWLKEFCLGMIERGYNKKINFDCNMRAAVLSQEDYDLMAQAGFRFILYGLESANQKSLDFINKGIKAGDIEKDCIMAKEANRKFRGCIEPHVTCMIGYPWENKEEAQKTIDLTRSLFKKGLIDSLQATIMIPYPGTSLFKYCAENDLLVTDDWERYDMREKIMKCPMSNEEIKEMTQGLYTSFLTPKFVLKKVLNIRGWSDFKFILSGGMKVLGHLRDFGRK